MLKPPALQPLPSLLSYGQHGNMGQGSANLYCLPYQTLEANGCCDCFRNVWHQLLRAMFESHSNFIAHDVLHIPDGTLIARYLKIWIAFFISGLIHAGMAETRYSIWGSGSVHFFCTQAFGIMLEDGVQALWSKALRSRPKPTGTPLWHKVIGFVWLLAFMSWSTPVWSYRLYQYYGPDIFHLLQFSIASHFA